MCAGIQNKMLVFYLGQQHVLSLVLYFASTLITISLYWTCHPRMCRIQEGAIWKMTARFICLSISLPSSMTTCQEATPRQVQSETTGITEHGLLRGLVVYNMNRLYLQKHLWVFIDCGCYAEEYDSGRFGVLLEIWDWCWSGGVWFILGFVSR